MSRHLNWELQTEDKLCTESDETKAKSNANCSKHSAEPRFISVFMFHGHAFRCMNAPAPLPVSFFYNPFNSILNPMTLLSQLLQVLWETLRSNNSLFYQCITWYELCLFHWQWHFFSGRPFFFTAERTTWLLFVNVKMSSVKNKKGLFILICKQSVQIYFVLKIFP